jgi:hypothetical protein
VSNNHSQRSYHIQRIGSSPLDAGISGRHDSTAKTLGVESWDNISKRMRGVSPTQEERSNVMPLIQLFEVLIVVGVLLWLVNRFIPMQSSIKSILNGVVVIVVVVWLLNVFGLLHNLTSLRVGKG